MTNLMDIINQSFSDKVIVKPEYLISVIKNIVKFINTSNEKNASEITKVRELYAELSKTIDALDKGTTYELNQIEKKIKEVETTPGDPGEDADPKEVYDMLKEDSDFIESLKGEGPDKEEILNDLITVLESSLAKFGITFRDGLELLVGDERLSKKAIKDLEEELLEIRTLIKKSGTGNGGNNPAGGGRGHIKTYDLSSVLDGVTKTFNLPANWTIIQVVSSSFPSAFRPIIDYTFTNTSITFTSEITASSTLASGQTLIVVYEEA